MSGRPLALELPPARARTTRRVHGRRRGSEDRDGYGGEKCVVDAAYSAGLTPLMGCFLSVPFTTCAALVGAGCGQLGAYPGPAKCTGAERPRGQDRELRSGLARSTRPRKGPIHRIESAQRSSGMRSTGVLLREDMVDFGLGVR